MDEPLVFVWDTLKATSNLQKHGVSFLEAQGVFYDPNAKLIYDPDHSDTEERFIMLGMSKIANLLVVCHCYKDDDTHIRIISARKATIKEGKNYRR
ncbi:hypothetical protein AGMMS49938_18990 [Fibrobacterales bacterium]|nr:hypothetical protein AGMMS49938_18990 [Fibrobacterales bacterium]